MAKSKEINDTEGVQAIISKLEPNLAEMVKQLREIILSVDKEIGEQVKWNSPAFFYMGDMAPFDPKEYKRDMVVFNLNRGYPLLVFPTGTKIKQAIKILEGKYTDGRRLITFKTIDDINAKAEELKKVIAEWLTLIEK